jgi:Tol biopolymer transport system component
MAPDGRDVRRLTTTAAGVDDGSPDISADGRWIVFSSTRDGNQQDLFVMAADGTGVRRLTGDARLDDVFPRWTTDGDRVLFQTFASVEGATEDIWSVTADGTDRTVVLKTPDRDAFPDPRP